MPNIAVCRICGKAFEESSEEAANNPWVVCFRCVCDERERKKIGLPTVRDSLRMFEAMDRSRPS